MSSTTLLFHGQQVMAPREAMVSLRQRKEARFGQKIRTLSLRRDKDAVVSPR